MGLLSIIRKIKRQGGGGAHPHGGSGQLGEDDDCAQDQRGRHECHQPHPRLQHQNHQVPQAAACLFTLIGNNVREFTCGEVPLTAMLPGLACPKCFWRVDLRPTWCDARLTPKACPSQYNTPFKPAKHKLQGGGERVRAAAVIQ